MNIGPKYQSTGIRVRVRRCSSVHMSVYYRGLHTPIPLVVTSHEGPLSPPSLRIRVHGHARLSRVNSSSFSDHLVTRVTAFPLSLPLSPSRWKLVARHTICPLPSSRSQGVRDIPSHENLIANPAETPGSCYKSFRELTSTVHENYEREDARKHGKNNRERRFRYIRSILRKFHTFCKMCHPVFCKYAVQNFIAL